MAGIAGNYGAQLHREEWSRRVRDCIGTGTAVQSEAHAIGDQNFAAVACTLRAAASRISGTSDAPAIAEEAVCPALSFEPGIAPSAAAQNGERDTTFCHFGSRPCRQWR